MSYLPFYDDAAPVTPNDSTDLTGGATRAINVTGAGNVKVTMRSGSTVVLAVAAGETRISVKRIWSTSTTATGITALY